MSDDRLADVLRVCEEAIAREGEDRAAYLDTACGADIALRREVDAVLAEQLGNAAQFLDTPPWQRPAPALTAGQRLGPYEVTATIGAGGMGAVYKARDTRLGRTVALKVIAGAGAMDPAARERFTREARTIAALSHSNVCTLYDVGREGDIDFLVMEHLDGETLQHRLHPDTKELKGKPLDVDEAVQIAIQMAEGLEAAHQAGVIHRDLKPANIILLKGAHGRRGLPQVKLLDFGLAKPRTAVVSAAGEGKGGGGWSMTGHGVTVGTAGYMSPEQARGEQVDARSDLFALGCVLYEMLAGERPFRGATAADVLAAILRDDPPVLPRSGRVPPGLDRIVRRCLEKQPAARFQSARDVILALEDGGATGVVGDSAQADKAPVGGRRRRTLVLSAVALISLLTIAGVSWKAWRFLSNHSAPAPSVLVLPAKVVGPPESAFLADATSATLSTLLVSVVALDVKQPPGTSVVRPFRDDFAKIAAMYGAANVVLSTVTADAQKLILDVKLVEVATRKARWGKQFAGTRSSYNALIKQTADAVADTLKPGSATSASVASPSETVLALEEGRSYLGAYSARHRPEDFEAALSAYQRVPESDPAFAFALGRQAELWASRGFSGKPEAKPLAFEHADSLARRAVERDPRAGSAWAALAQIAYHTPPAKLEKVLECALKTASPWEPWGSMVERVLVATVGGANLMASAGGRIFDLNPFELNNGSFAAMGLAWQGRFQESINMADRVLKVDPMRRPALAAKSEALIGLGRLQETHALLERRPPADDDGSWPAEYWRQIRFQLAVAEGDKATADKLADRAAALWLGPGAQDMDANAPITMSVALVQMGRREQALRMLEKGFQSVASAEGYLWVLRQPGLRPLQDDSRFVRLVDKGRGDVAVTVRVLERAKASGQLPAFLAPFLIEMKVLLRERTLGRA